MNDKQKEFEFKDRKFIIKKLDPVTGNYWMWQLVASLSDIPSFDGSGIIKCVMDFVKHLTQNKKTFFEFQRDILSVVFEKLDAGQQAIIQHDGALVLLDATSPLVFNLTVEAFSFTVTDFFDEGFIKSLIQPFLKLMKESPITQPSTNSSTSPLDMGTGDNTNSGMEPMMFQIGLT